LTASRFRVRWGDAEVEYEGQDAAQKYDAILEHLLRERPAPAKFPTIKSNDSQTGILNLPQIAPAGSVAKSLFALLGTEWGRSNLRGAGELNEALIVNAIHVSRGTLTGTLTQLVQKGKLRRIRKPDGAYGYALPLGVLSQGDELAKV
jgi:hypothetical protein